MNNIFFPFHRKHEYIFLTKKWWFRLITIAFVLLFIFQVLNIWSMNINNVYDICMEEKTFTHSWPTPYQRKNIENECINKGLTSWKKNVPYTIGLSILIFYIVQIFFFKIIVNYIILNNKTSHE